MDHPEICYVKYGTDENNLDKSSDILPTEEPSSHQVKLTDLDRSTTYHYSVIVRNQWKEAQTELESFTTLGLYS